MPKDLRAEDTTLLCFPANDAKRLLRVEEESSIKNEKIAILEQKISILQKENDLLNQQIKMQEQLTELAKRESELYKMAFEKEKELTDRALKLAEISKPKSNWELQGLIGMAALVVGFVLAK